MDQQHQNDLSAHRSRRSFCTEAIQIACTSWYDTCLGKLFGPWYSKYGRVTDVVSDVTDVVSKQHELNMRKNSGGNLTGTNAL